MMTVSDTDGLTKSTRTAKHNHEALKIDSYTGALALIDILYDMGSINQATYDAIKRNTTKTFTN